LQFVFAALGARQPQIHEFCSTAFRDEANLFHLAII
jgi:hypothetical protein